MLDFLYRLSDKNYSLEMFSTTGLSRIGLEFGICCLRRQCMLEIVHMLYQCNLGDVLDNFRRIANIEMLKKCNWWRCIQFKQPKCPMALFYISVMMQNF